jgi:hypothetical protein
MNKIITAAKTNKRNKIITQQHEEQQQQQGSEVCALEVLCCGNTRRMFRLAGPRAPVLP